MAKNRSASVVAASPRARTRSTTPRRSKQQKPTTSTEPPQQTRAIVAAEGRGDAGLRALDGLRAVLNLWIMAFHALFVMTYFVTQQEAERLFWKLPLLEHGYLAVDGFFVLTGYLLALQLYNSAPTGTYTTAAAWLRKYARQRLIRIMLPFIVLAVLHCAVVNRGGVYAKDAVRLAPARDIFERFFPAPLTSVDNGCATVPVNLLHLPQLMPFNGCFMHSWSVSVQYHAYVWLPIAWWLLQLGQGRRLLTFAGALTTAATLLRAVGQRHSSQFEAATIVGGAAELYWYSHLLSRVHTIGLGAVAAWVSRERPTLLQSAGLRRALYAFCAVFLALQFGWREWFGDCRFEAWWGHTLFVALLQVGTVSCALVWCTVLLLARHGAGRVGSVLQAALSHRAWKVPAELSYWAYLLHPMLMTYLFSRHALLFPGSSIDARPASDEPAILDSLHSAVLISAQAVLGEGSSIAAALSQAAVAAASAWFAVRDWAIPPGQPLSIWQLLSVHATASIAVTYAVSALLYHQLEKPVIKLLNSGVLLSVAVQERLAWGYHILLAVLAPVAQAVGLAAVLLFVTPELEQTLVPAAGSNTTGTAV